MEFLTQKKGIHDRIPFLSNNCSTGESPTLLKYKNFVPVDYLKGEIIEMDVQEILHNPLLDFTQPINTDSGELSRHKNPTGKPKAEHRKAKFNNLQFVYYPETGRMLFAGSLHKFYNHGIHNHNDFTVNRFWRAIRRLKEQFGITPKNIKINQLEWGVNVVLPIKTSTFLNHCLFISNKRVINTMDTRQAKYHLATFDEYCIKLYDKGLQHKLKGDLLRFERKQKDYNKYCSIHHIGQTLFNLIESNFIGLKATLLNDWERLLFVDPELTNHPKYLKYSNPKFWELLRLKKSGNSLVLRHRKHLHEMSIENGGDTKSKIKEIILEKLIELQRDVYTFSPYSYRRKTYTPPKKNLKILSTHYGLQRA
jgi:hypothetical protein